MRSPKPIEFQLGDIIESKRNPTKGYKYLIVEKRYREETIWGEDNFLYVVYSFQTQDYFSIFRNFNTQHWKIVG